LSFLCCELVALFQFYDPGPPSHFDDPVGTSKCRSLQNLLKSQETRHNRSFPCARRIHREENYYEQRSPSNHDPGRQTASSTGGWGDKENDTKNRHLLYIPISPEIIITCPPIDLQGTYPFRESMTLALLHLPGTRERRGGWTIIAAQSTCQVKVGEEL
jgi:hypothetical protein